MEEISSTSGYAELPPPPFGVTRQSLEGDTWVTEMTSPTPTAQGGDEKLVELLEACWPGLNSGIVVPKNLLRVYFTTAVDRLINQVRNKNTLKQLAELKTLRYEMSLLFFRLSQRDMKFFTSLNSAIKSLETIKVTGSSGRLLNKIYDRLKTFNTICGENTACLYKPMGKSGDFDRHFAFLDSFLGKRSRGVDAVIEGFASAA